MSGFPPPHPGLGAPPATGIGSTAAIFSPTAARQAATAQRDWHAVDSWLSSTSGGVLHSASTRRQHGGHQQPPRFERNPDTLRALLALAQLNELADEERALLARTDALALAELKRAEAAEKQGDVDGAPTLPAFRAAVLASLESHLPPEAASALDSLARLALALDLAATPDPATVGAALVALTAGKGELERLGARADALGRYAAEQEQERTEDVKTAAGGPAFKVPRDAAKSNLETQRRVRALASSTVPEARDGAQALSAQLKSATGGVVGLDEVRTEEAELKEALAKVSQLQGLVDAFEGLPPDPDLAREELQELEETLVRLTARRDALFEGLVETESPVKR